MISRKILYVVIQILCVIIALSFLTKILWTWFHEFFFLFQVVHVLLNECNIIYECKVCFNMFRSLANFISHKRSFCKNKGDNILHVFSNEDGNSGKEIWQKIFCQIVSISRNFYFSAERIVSVQPEPVETVFPEPEFELQDYSPSLEVRIYFIHPTGWNFKTFF